MNSNKTLIVILLLLMVSNVVLSQRKELIAEQADKYYENAQYQQAISYYKSALSEDSRYTKAIYMLGESYRATFDYESAEYYYERLANKDRRYPLAGYHFGSMLKYKGDYQSALTIFRSFDKFLKENNLHENPQYRYYYKQSKIEIDGCQLALNQQSVNYPTHQFELLSDPLNSPSIEYAAFSLANDSILCLTSARKGGKGKILDNEFGESLVDLFRFQLDDNGNWKEYKVKDRFDIVNTKWGDGSGSFNRDRTRFYYTNCDGDIGEFCHIYVSDLVDGRWTEPIALNSNVNVFGYDSQHPNLTPGGDTLFFVSDKKGTFGGHDIWMSVKTSSDNWGPAINLGESINTPFNEVSPFYDHKENVLFFASDGHRGLGGFDIYIAKGNSLTTAEIYNAGLPFNSNRDDLFFFLGNKRGYLTSNRDGGLGKFDIWGFNIRSKEEIIDEVAIASSIAGRNALFTDDYNFDNKNVEIINQIISRTISSKISNVEVLLTEEQLEVYNSLSLDDKERVDKIVNARMRQMNSSMMRSIRSEDDFYYQQLTTDKRQKVDEVVSSYITQNGLGLSVKLDESDSFYQQLEDEEREKVDILISERIRSTENFNVIPFAYNSYNSDEKKLINGITRKFLAQKRDLSSIPLSIKERVFMNETGSDQIPKLSSAIRESIVLLSDDKEYFLNQEDKVYYENMPFEEKESLTSLAHALMVADLTNFESLVIPPEAVNLYRLKDPQTKKRLDKILVKQVKNMAIQATYVAESNFTKSELIDLSAEPVDELVISKIRSMRPRLTANEKTSLDRFVRTTFRGYAVGGNAVFIDESLGRTPITASIQRPSFINQQPLGDPKATLSSTSINAYQSLDLEDKKLIDRLIAFEYLNESYEENSLEIADEEAYKGLPQREKLYVEILSKDLKGDGMSQASSIQRAEAYQYYNNLPSISKAFVNRVVASKTFAKRGSNYVLNANDANGRLTLDEDKKNLLLSMKRFRNNNERILTENIDVESKDVDSDESDKTVLVAESNLPTNNSSRVDNYGDANISNDEIFVNANETKSEQIPSSNIVTYNSEKVNSIQSSDNKVVKRTESGFEINEEGAVYASGVLSLTVPEITAIEKGNEISLTGQLLDNKGEPISSKAIKLKDFAKNETILTRYTEADGSFAFNTENDNYTIVLEDEQAKSYKLAKVIINENNALVSEEVLVEESVAVEQNGNILLNTPSLKSAKLGDQVTISGQVLNKNGLPMKSKIVQLKHKVGNETVAQGYTDSNGNFEFDAENDEYTILVQNASKATIQVSDIIVRRVLNDTSITDKLTTDLRQVDEEKSSSTYRVSSLSSNMAIDQVVISGQLTDLKGEPISGKVIELKSRNLNETVTTGYTNNNGVFSFNAKNDDYNILIQDASSDSYNINDVTVIEAKEEFASTSDKTFIDTSLAVKKNGELTLELPPLKSAKPNDQILVSGQVIDNYGQPIEYNSVELIAKGEYGTVIEGYTNRSGNFDFSVKNDAYDIKVNKPSQGVAQLANVSLTKEKSVAYESDEISVDTDNAKEIQGAVRLALPMFNTTNFYDQIRVSGQLIDANGKPIASKAIDLIESDQLETVIEGYTDKYGYFDFKVKNDEYVIKVDESSLGDVKLINVNMKGQKEGIGTNFNRVTRAYFDLGSSDLRSETKVLMDEIVDAYLREKFKVEIEAHTDGTGNSARNLVLSKERGYTALYYLASRGVNKSDISLIWHGQEKPIASNETAIGRQLNRRLDIRVKSNNIRLNFGHFFLTQPGANITQIAGSFNITVKELMEINGMENSFLKAYQPIRVRTLNGVNPSSSLLVPADISTVSSNLSHTVQVGETLHDIARKYNIPEELLLELNKLSFPSDIVPGMKLIIYPEN